MRELSRISDDEINKIADKMSDYFLKDIRKNSFSIDRKSTRLNSSHVVISYAVFCLKKKTNTHTLSQF